MLNVLADLYGDIPAFSRICEGGRLNVASLEKIVAQPHRCRWRIELPSRCIKRRLRLRGSFYSSPTGKRVHIWAMPRASFVVAIAIQ